VSEEEPETRELQKKVLVYFHYEVTQGMEVPWGGWFRWWKHPKPDLVLYRKDAPKEYQFFHGPPRWNPYLWRTMYKAPENSSGIVLLALQGTNYDRNVGTQVLHVGVEGVNALYNQFNDFPGRQEVLSDIGPIRGALENQYVPGCALDLSLLPDYLTTKPMNTVVSAKLEEMKAEEGHC
jgi:hypothetical protein